MNILIFNCGSSSQGFKVYRVSEGGTRELLASGKARNVATKTRADAVIDWKIQQKSGSKPAELPSHRIAAENNLAILQENGIEVHAVGHRFVHGGERFQGTEQVNDGVMEDLENSFRLAPIHNPNSYSVIEVCREMLPGIPQYVVFDTAFHAQMPAEAREYALPRHVSAEHGFRKYGFHGLSYQFVSARTAEFLQKPLQELKLILCHLGTGGSSVVAVQHGRSMDTSMGYSPLPGLVMSTRCGDIDAEIVLELIRSGYSADEVSNILNNQSGLVGLSGFSSNLGEIIEESEKGNEDCRVAYDAYVHRLRHYIGAYHWLLDRADAIVFTDDIGLKSWKLRRRVCSGVENLGVIIDEDKNRQAAVDTVTCVSGSESATIILVVPTDEELVILEEVLSCVEES